MLNALRFIHDFHNFRTSGGLRIISSPQEKWYPECFNRAEIWHVPPLKVCSQWYSKLSEKEFTDLELVWKNMVEILLKSAVCQNAICPGGVLLSEVASSPLQVIRRLRVGAALGGFETVV